MASNYKRSGALLGTAAAILTEASKDGASAAAKDLKDTFKSILK
jgi:hypothetical protein